jgi:hypothetical protein
VGSVRQLADANAQVVLARGYTPYGEPLWVQGTTSSRYAFTGEDYDPQVGLLFLRARYMQPMSIGGSSDPAIVGKVIRSVLRQTVARTSDRRFNLGKQVQAIATPFSSSGCQAVNSANWVFAVVPPGVQWCSWCGG